MGRFAIKKYWALLDDPEALDHIDTLEWDAEAIPEA